MRNSAKDRVKKEDAGSELCNKYGTHINAHTNTNVENSNNATTENNGSEEDSLRSLKIEERNANTHKQLSQIPMNHWRSIMFEEDK